MLQETIKANKAVTAQAENELDRTKPISRSAPSLVDVPLYKFDPPPPAADDISNEKPLSHLLDGADYFDRVLDYPSKVPLASSVTIDPYQINKSDITGGEPKDTESQQRRDFVRKVCVYCLSPYSNASSKYCVINNYFWFGTTPFSLILSKFLSFYRLSVFI